MDASILIYNWINSNIQHIEHTFIHTCTYILTYFNDYFVSYSHRSLNDRRNCSWYIKNQDHSYMYKFNGNSTVCSCG